MKLANRYLKIFLLVVASCFVYPVLTHAASGDISGSYYYTDIKTYLYYSPITSYNIGGKTIIDAEILNWHYGFDVYWHSDTRRLELIDKGGMFNSLQAMSGDLCKSVDGVPGNIAGNYYETDIITTLNGKEIESYNIGGKTCIVAEEMRNFGYDVTWNAEKRTLTITKPIDFYSIETDYGIIKTRNNYESSVLNFKKYNRGIILTNNDGTQAELSIPSKCVLLNPNGVSYVKLSDICTILNTKCTLEETEKTSHSEWVNGISYDESYYDYCFKFSYKNMTNLTLKRIQTDYPYEILKNQDFGKCYQINDVKISINGETGQFVSKIGGTEYTEGILIIDSAIYIPTYMIAKIVGYSLAN